MTRHPLRPYPQRKWVRGHHPSYRCRHVQWVRRSDPRYQQIMDAGRWWKQPRPYKSSPKARPPKHPMFGVWVRIHEWRRMIPIGNKHDQNALAH